MEVYGGATSFDEKFSACNPLEKARCCGTTDMELAHHSGNHTKSSFENRDVVAGPSFTVLNKEDIRLRVETEIAKVSAILSVSRQTAILLLSNCKWELNRIFEICLVQEDEACNFILEDPDSGGLSDYDDDDLGKSFVQDCKSIKRCPAPGCEYAVEYDGHDDGVGSCGRNLNVTCTCSHVFCWNCLEEAHNPVDCETALKWALKVNSDLETKNWILAYSKPCASCKRPIQKNNGGINITCASPCGFEFCWLCLDGWSGKHNASTGGCFSCCHYEEAKEEGKYDEIERKRKRARTSVAKHTRYYERWVVNTVLTNRALKTKQELQDVVLERLSEIQNESLMMLSFIADAWDQLVQCGRALKWAYVYGYYIPKDEKKKREFFDYLREQAEDALERLLDCAEVKLFRYVEAKRPLKKKFKAFRGKLINLTLVTRNYFSNFARTLENGISEVESSSTG